MGSIKFHYVAFCPGGKPISYSVFQKASWFQPLKAYSAFRSFSPICLHFYKRALERGEVKLRQVVYEV